MKIIGVIIMSLLTATSSHANSQLVSDSVMEVLQQYTQGTEHSDITILEEAFHQDFRVVAITAEGLRVINRNDYLALIKAKKIGGNKRHLSLKSVIEGENVMQISLTLSAEKTIFHDHLDLIKQDGRWQILHNSTQVSAQN
jgi:hypothetical protein